MHEMADWKDVDTAYANGAFIPGGAGYPALWAERSARFRAEIGARGLLDQPYGRAPRQKFDLFLPQSKPRGLFVFVHGGYWVQFGRESWSHLAQGSLQAGWACCMPSYTLAPDAAIPDITREIAAAIMASMERVKGPVVVSGHSAGGHLAARMACEDSAVEVARVVPISPLSELEPLMQTAMQASLRLNPEHCAAESPARLAKVHGTSAHVWVGGQERPSFLWQARMLSEAWNCPWTVAPGKHHFDVIDELADCHSPLLKTCLDTTS